MTQYGASALVAGASEFRAWPGGGPHPEEGNAAYHRARRAGYPEKQARSLGLIATFEDGYLVRTTIARIERMSVRTVGRAIGRAKAEGRLKVWFAKKDEIPPRSRTGEPLRFRWTHRKTPGWGLQGRAIHEEIAKQRLLMQQRTALASTRAALRTGTVQTRAHATSAHATSAHATRRPRTAEQLDAELERIPRTEPAKQRDGPG